MCESSAFLAYDVQHSELLCHVSCSCARPFSCGGAIFWCLSLAATSSALGCWRSHMDVRQSPYSWAVGPVQIERCQPSSARWARHCFELSLPLHLSVSVDAAWTSLKYTCCILFGEEVNTEVFLQPSHTWLGPLLRCSATGVRSRSRFSYGSSHLLFFLTSRVCPSFFFLFSFSPSPNFACEWGSYLCLENCPWIPGFLVALAARIPKLSLDSRISRRRRRQGA